MLTPPPWYFSGNVIWIECAVDPDAAARFLPAGLDLGPEAGAAAAVFAEWQWCSASREELADPVRCQFSEFLLLLDCVHGGRRVARCPYAWVDSAVSLTRGWVQGMPKQLGVIRMSRMIDIGRAGGGRTPGRLLAATVSAGDRRIAEARVTLAEPVAEAPFMSRLPLVHSRLFPAWLPGERPVRGLTASVVEDVEFSPVLAGPATLRFAADLAEGPDPDLPLLAPVEVGTGYAFGYAETLVGGEALT